MTNQKCEGCGETYDAFEESHIGHIPESSELFRRVVKAIEEVQAHDLATLEPPISFPEDLARAAIGAFLATLKEKPDATISEAPATMSRSSWAQGANWMKDQIIGPWTREEAK